MATKERAAVKRYMEAVRRGEFDKAMHLVGEVGPRQAAVAERLARFCVLAGQESLVVMQEWYAPEGIAMEEVLVVMGKKWDTDDKDLAKRSAAVAVESLAGLQAGRDSEVEAQLKGMEPDELGEVALAMAVLAIEHTRAQEEQERVRVWRVAPAA